MLKSFVCFLLLKKRKGKQNVLHTDEKKNFSYPKETVFLLGLVQIGLAFFLFLRPSCHFHSKVKRRPFLSTMSCANSGIVKIKFNEYR